MRSFPCALLLALHVRAQFLLSSIQEEEYQSNLGYDLADARDD